MSDESPLVHDIVDDTPVTDELHNSFLSYAMSVIVSRALPDVRDGLKPVHRRILYSMVKSGLRPGHAYVKSARVVGDCMGKYHPHGDAAIYDAMVRMAQDFSLRVPLVDGHGNFGTHHDSPAAMRYTESRMTPAAEAMSDEWDEDTVDMVDNYDGKLQEPTVLPAAFPNLLVNGSTGIAVGMATNMAPHNLTEVVAACQHFLADPDVTSEALLAHVKGPDLPTGGEVVVTDAMKQAYLTGRGTFTMRARAQFEDVSARKRGIVITELPYLVGPEKVIARIKELKDAKKLDGVTGVIDLSDRKHGLRLVIELKSGVNEKAVLATLYRLTPLQENFTIHNLALVDSSPTTCSLRQLIGHYVNHRLDVIRRRSAFRKAKAEARAHLLDGYLIALANIDEVVAQIRAADSNDDARVRLTTAFALDDVQADAILEMPLRRLTKLEVDKITAERDQLRARIAELAGILAEESKLKAVVAKELDDQVKLFGTPRRTRLLSAETVDKEQAAAAGSSTLPDTPVVVTWSTTGRIGRVDTRARIRKPGVHDVLAWTASLPLTDTLVMVSSTGRLLGLPVWELPDASGAGRGLDLRDLVDLHPGEQVASILGPGSADTDLVLVTDGGGLKKLTPAVWHTRVGKPVLTVPDGATVTSAGFASAGDQVVMVSSGGQLLRTTLDVVNPKGASAGVVAGMKLGDARLICAAVIPTGSAVTLWTATDSGMVKSTPVGDYPAKGRGGAGVRCHRLGAHDTCLVAAAIVADPATVVGVDATGTAVTLPEADGRRDGGGVQAQRLTGFGHRR